MGIREFNKLYKKERKEHPSLPSWAITQKGTIFDVFFLSVVIIVAMIAILVGFYIFAQIRGSFALDPHFNATSLELMQDSLDTVAQWNNLLLFVYIGAGIGTVISAFAVRTHPIFFVMFLLVQLVMLTVLPMLSGAYTTISNSTVFNATAATYFSNFSTIITYTPLIALALSVLIALAMFALPG